MILYYIILYIYIHTQDSLLRMPGDSHRQSEPQISRRYLGASIAIDFRYTNTAPR